MSKFIEKLFKVTYCRIGVSKVKNAGVGVIAIRDIPKGVNPFNYVKHKCNYHHSKVVKLHRKEVKYAPPFLQKLIIDFISPDDKGYYSVPEDGFNSLDISFYMNHSGKPNVKAIEDECYFFAFVTTRNIKAGEELYIDYGKF